MGIQRISFAVKTNVVWGKQRERPKEPTSKSTQPSSTQPSSLIGKQRFYYGSHQFENEKFQWFNWILKRGWCLLESSNWNFGRRQLTALIKRRTMKLVRLNGWFTNSLCTQNFLIKILSNPKPLCTTRWFARVVSLCDSRDSKVSRLALQAELIKVV